MSYLSRLDQAFKNAPTLPWTSSSRYVLFSDCHRGNGSISDNFLPNRHLFIAALKYYDMNHFTYIELGDGDELWENTNMSQIKEAHCEVFHLLSHFYEKGRLYMLYGNHDIIKKTQKSDLLFPDITFYSGLILRNASEEKELYLTHGHQASLLNSTLWPLGCFLVRYVWKPLEILGIPDPTSASKNHHTRNRTEKRLMNWSSITKRTLITGHTHRSLILDKPANYLNTGSCVHPAGITCIEILGTDIYLVKWFMDARSDGILYVKRQKLPQKKEAVL